MSKNPTRRDVLAAAATSSLVARAAAPAKPALLGGKPVRTTQFPSWPMIEENDERQWMDVLKSKRWNRVGGSYRTHGFIWIHTSSYSSASSRPAAVAAVSRGGFGSSGARLSAGG